MSQCDIIVTFVQSCSRCFKYLLCLANRDSYHNTYMTSFHSSRIRCKLSSLSKYKLLFLLSTTILKFLLCCIVGAITSDTNTNTLSIHENIKFFLCIRRIELWLDTSDFDFSSMFESFLSTSGSNTSLLTGLLMILFSVLRVTTLTYPSSPWCNSCIRASVHFPEGKLLSFIITISPTCRFVCSDRHLVLDWSCCRYYTDHILRNCLLIDCTSCHFIVILYASGSVCGRDSRDPPTKKCPGVR